MMSIKLLLASAAVLALTACEQKAPEPPPAELGPDTAQAEPAIPTIMPIAEQGDGGVSDFYDLAGPAPAKPGTLIRTEAQPEGTSLAEAAQAMRILYSSTNGLDGSTPVAVSGSLFVPKGDAPAGGFPLIAWAHGTVGVADTCAPSNNPRSERDTKYLNHWLQQGYAVVASDYQGLGTPGGHPYLATRPASYSVLDGIRAVQSDPNLKLSKSVVLVGQSQGGGAAFATAGEAVTYAPDLDIRGTVATGTPYFTNDSAPAVRDPSAVSPVFAYSIYIMYLAEQADPSFKITDYVNEKAATLIESTRTECFGKTAKLVMDEKFSPATAFAKDPTSAIAKYYPLMAYSTLKVKGPVFLGTGGKDKDVPPPGQQRLVNDACAAGAVIQHKLYPDLDHSGTVNGSLADSTPFVKAAFAGQPIPGNCKTSTSPASSDGTAR